MRKWHYIAFNALIVSFFIPKIVAVSFGKPLVEKVMGSKIEADVRIGSVKLSWFGPQKFERVRWTKEGVSGTIEELQMDTPFWSFSGPFQLKNGSIAYPGGTVEQIQGKIEGNHLALTGVTSEEGHLSVMGDVYSKKDYNIQFDVKNFPLAVVDHQLDQILGNKVDLIGSANLKNGAGNVNLAVTTQNLTTEIQASLTEDAVTLRDPWTLSIKSTPELSAYLLKDINPLFLKEIEATSPIELTFEPKDFHLPIPFSMDKFVARGTVDFGKVKCRNGKSLTTVMSLLKITEFTHLKNMNVWFTPLPFYMHEGVVETGRVDLLVADSIHVCTWGKIHLNRDEIRMTLGIPADTLKKSFGIHGLSENYVLKVDVRGPINDPEIVTGPPAAKIAALMAGGQIPKKGILGEVAAVFSNPKEEKDVPPAERPFPWEQ